MRFAVGVGAGLLVASQACIAQGTSAEAMCEKYRQQTGKVHPRCANVAAPRSTPGAQTKPASESAQPGAPLHQPQLAEMPTFERVMREITHADPLEAAARQAGAFFQLEAMVEILSDGRNFRRQLTAEEDRIIKSYRQGNGVVYKNAQGLLPQGNPGEQPSPGVKWQNRVNAYRFSKEYQAALLQKFFSASWQQYFLAIQTRQEQTVAEREEKRRAAEAKAREAPVPSIVDSAKVQKPSAGRPASEDMARQVGEVLGGLHEVAREAHMAECAKIGPPRPAGARLTGVYENGWTGTYSTWAAIDFDCGVILFCGAEEKFREYHASNAQVTAGKFTFARRSDGTLAGPREVIVKKRQPATYNTETSYEYSRGGSVVARSVTPVGPSQTVTSGDGWRRVDKETLASPESTIDVPCAVGALRKRAQ